MKNRKLKVAKKQSLSRSSKPTGNVKSDFKKWYKRKIWRETLRPECLRRDNYTCQMEGCGINLGHAPHLLHADHKIPHRGIWERFIDLNNLWTLCHECHNREKQLIERGMGE